MPCRSLHLQEEKRRQQLMFGVTVASAPAARFLLSLSASGALFFTLLHYGVSVPHATPYSILYTQAAFIHTFSVFQKLRVTWWTDFDMVHSLLYMVHGRVNHPGFKRRPRPRLANSERQPICLRQGLEAVSVSHDSCFAMYYCPVSRSTISGFLPRRSVQATGPKSLVRDKQRTPNAIKPTPCRRQRLSSLGRVRPNLDHAAHNHIRTLSHCTYERTVRHPSVSVQSSTHFMARTALTSALYGKDPRNNT
ncbi:uncharacterized protein BDZ83DRAFT_32425 [Colletotrichum acutatum]|uniref:Uncharacterized protein n=1 Tax=Glomerella acutata TaxID=27357 RepID=A0AAD8XL90_GLOAC|nr:uncharacterized protein BDZ83DRAFT_32425 [Colletotrichum acutatum]KAK1729451.1 hypothetical protein BDZ83DRAFT_32425 [Colletotrichum acutatum]